MDITKLVNVPLYGQMKLWKEHCLTNGDEQGMRNVTYSFVLGSLMCVMIFTRLNITYVVGVVSQFLPNPSYKHWNSVK